MRKKWTRIAFMILNLSLWRIFSLSSIEMQDSMKHSMNNYTRKSRRFHANFSRLSKTINATRKNKGIWNLRRKKLRHNWNFKIFTKGGQTIKNIDLEISNYVTEHHLKELIEKLLRSCEQDCKSTECRSKDESE